MADKTLQFRLIGVGADGAILLGDLQDFTHALIACLRKCEIKTDSTGLEYRLVGLSHGSCSVKLLPVRNDKPCDAGTKVIRLLKETIRSLEKGKVLNPLIDSHDLQVFKRLVLPFKQRFQSIQFGNIRLTDKYTKTIEQLLSRPSYAEGEVTGVLEKLDIHAKSTFTLWPRIGSPVTCHFEKRLLDQVKLAIGRTVTVQGKLSYYLGSVFPTRAKITQIDIHPNDDELPTLMDLLGSTGVYSAF